MPERLEQPGRTTENRDRSRIHHLTDLLSYRISVLNRAFEQEAGRNLAKKHELSLTEARVLGVLEELSTTTVKHLGMVMRLKRPQVSRALALLREQGFVEAWQNPADGRSTNYAITKTGRQRARRILRIATGYHHERLAVLTGEELAALNSAIAKLLAGRPRSTVSDRSAPRSAYPQRP
jgi:DNA-binding MarR family transcriptional regulator